MREIERLNMAREASGMGGDDPGKRQAMMLPVQGQDQLVHVVESDEGEQGEGQSVTILLRSLASQRK